METIPKGRRVVIVAHEYRPFTGGIANYVHEVATTLASQRVQVEIVAPSYGGDQSGGETGLRVRRFLRHSHVTAATLCRAIGFILGSRDAVFHAADIRSAVVLRIARCLGGPPYLVSIHGTDVIGLWKPNPAYALARWACRSAEAVFANSQATADIYRRTVGKAVRLTVAHPGVDRRWFAPPPGTFLSADLQCLDPGAILLCSVGRIDRRKGHLTALEALARLKNLSGFARIAYVLAGPIGDRGYAEEILRHAGSLGVRCLLTGRLEEGDLRRLYRTSLCHVLSAVTMPGKIEGFGLVILEAAAQGCPTVASRVGGIPEVVADGGTGYLCGEKDVEGIASRMAALIQDRGLRETMSLRAHDHARGFTWLKCVQTIYNGKIALDAGGE